MSKTASGTAGDPLVFMISKRKRGRLLTYKKSLQFGKQARGMILVFFTRSKQAPEGRDTSWL